MLLRSLLAATIVAGTMSVALADPVDDYSYWRTAGSLDNICHYLKYVERDAILAIAFEALDQTGQRAHMLDGRMSADDYNKWLDGLDDAADAKAAEIGCTAAAEPYLLAARGRASERLYQNLTLAFHFAGLPADNLYLQPLAADQVEAAQRYDGFLQQVYGANYQGFIAAQRAAATARLPPAAMAPQYDEFGTPIVDYYLGLMSDKEYEQLWAAQSAARFTIEKVQFEVSAETNGLLVWPKWVQRYWTVPTLNKADTGALWATVFHGPSTFRLDTGEEIFGVFAQMADSSLRLMTYGTNAAKLKETGVARLFVRSEEPPPDTASYAIFDLPEFRTMAFPFDGVPVSEPCLGGPCWTFSAETLEALYATAPDEYAELWLSTDPEAAPSATIDPGTSYLRGRLSAALLWRINDRPLPVAAEGAAK